MALCFGRWISTQKQSLTTFWGFTLILSVQFMRVSQDVLTFARSPFTALEQEGNR